MVVARFFRSSPLGGVCALLLLLLVSVAALADRLAPYNPLTANYALTRDPPLGRHVLGTDHLGRDVLSRIIFGARVTLMVAISSVLLGDTIGFLWGLSSGYLGAAIFIEAALSFVGVGVPPPTPSWGNMLGGVLAEAFKPPWWMVVFPGTAITVTILAVNLFGDALRDFLDPKLQ